jgi:hypothetical protein
VYERMCEKRGERNKEWKDERGREGRWIGRGRGGA